MYQSFVKSITVISWLMRSIRHGTKIFESSHRKNRVIIPSSNVKTPFVNKRHNLHQATHMCVAWSLSSSYFLFCFLFCTIYPAMAPLVAKPMTVPMEGCGVKMYITAPMPPHINPPKIVPSIIALIFLSSTIYHYWTLRELIIDSLITKRIMAIP